MGPDEMLLLQMYLDFVSNLKLYPMSIMALLVVSIGFLKNLMDLLVDVMNPLNEYCGFFDHKMIMGRVCMCGARGSETSMGHKGWNPSPTRNGLWQVELWRALL
jgi:hypothetical protein